MNHVGTVALSYIKHNLQLPLTSIKHLVKLHFTITNYVVIW